MKESQALSMTRKILIDRGLPIDNKYEWDSLTLIEILVEIDKALDGKVALIVEMQQANSISSLINTLKKHQLIW